MLLLLQLLFEPGNRDLLLALPVLRQYHLRLNLLFFRQGCHLDGPALAVLLPEGLRDVQEPVVVLHEQLLGHRPLQLVLSGHVVPGEYRVLAPA